MKKFQMFALSAITAFGLFSCQGGGNTTTPNVNLKSSTDSLSYAYGTQLAQSGLTKYLEEVGIVQDTAIFKASLQQEITAETNTTKKASLESKVKMRVDSLTKANDNNMKLLLKGLNESFNTTNKEQNAYFNGLQLGGQIKKMTESFEKQVLDSGSVINKPAFLAGLIGILKKETPKIENAAQIIETKAKARQEEEQSKEEAELRKKYAAEIEAGEKFLEANKSNTHIVVLPSGLQYQILKKGNGEKPTTTSRVKVNYKGTLIDGKIFDSNSGKEPITLGVNQVIKGWTEALQLMPVGSKWKLFIPYDLGYGAQGAGSIPPFSPLIFEIELISIDK